jgi:predicted deacetylase
MGLKTDRSLVDAQLSEMEATIENIAFFTVISNLAINQLMECEAATTIIIKVVLTEEPKWTIMMAKNVRQMVNRAMKTLVDVLKQNERKFNLHLTSFKAREGETKKQLVEQLNT